MKYLNDLQEGMGIREIYYCKQKNTTTTKNGKEYWNVILQDKTGIMEAKVWDIASPSIMDFEAGDFVHIYGEVITYNGILQIRINQTTPAGEGEYNPDEYFAKSPYDLETMWAELTEFINSVKNPHLNRLLQSVFLEDAKTAERFKKNSAAKSVHHGFIGGLLQHTLAVTKNCEYMARQYPILNRDLLITAALLHDIGKTREISAFPENDYTDEGNLLGHIVMGVQIVDAALVNIPDFPETLKAELEHCILAHHGKLEYGSPKVPAIVEAVALNFADNMDAKLEIFTEIAERNNTTDWLGFNRLLESNVRLTKGK